MDFATGNSRIPTIDDLRVKFCYICQEEELYSAPENPPRAWTHPCTCTLIAHEKCLLRWIQASQTESSRAANALKCPQCGTKYELVSKSPGILRLLGLANRTLKTAGRAVTVLGTAGVVGVFTSGIYALATVYGSWAVKQFIGPEMHALLLTDDPEKWRWTSFLNLPSIPFALVIARFQSNRLIPSIIPLLLLYPPIPPPYLHAALTSNSDLFLPEDLSIRPLSDTLWSWPPTPALFGFVIVPLTRYFYRKAWSRLQLYVLGTVPKGVKNGSSFTFNWQFDIHINRRNQQAEGQAGEAQQQPEQGQARPAAQQDLEQVVDLPAAQQEHLRPEDQLPDHGPPAVEAAAEMIATARSSFGRRIGGALLIPYISARMGALLLTLSKHSTTLRRILGVRPPLNLATTLVQGQSPTNIVTHVQRSLQYLWQSMLGGSQVWTRADPVWWRNALGLGIFVVVKDAVELLHLWLATREMESRHVKNRNFADVDIRELDLIPGFFRPTTSASRTQQQHRARSLPRGF